MLNEREFVIALYSALREEVNDLFASKSNRLTKSIIVYTEPVRLSSGEFVSCFAYREEDSGSGNGGVIRMRSADEIERRLESDRRNSTEVQMVRASDIAVRVDEYYANGTGRSLPASNIGHKGANILTTVAQMIDDLEIEFEHFMDMLIDIKIEPISYMKSSAVLSDDMLDMMDGYGKSNNAFYSPGGFTLRPIKVDENGKVHGVLGITGDVRKATKYDVI